MWKDPEIYQKGLWTTHTRMIGPKDTQKKCPIKVIETTMRAQTQELSFCVCLCACSHILYAFPLSLYCRQTLYQLSYTCRFFVDDMYPFKEISSVHSFSVNFYQEWTLDFVKCFFWTIKVIVSFCLVLSSVCEYVNREWLLNVKPPLYSSNKLHDVIFYI